MESIRAIWKNNGLSLVFFGLFLVFLFMQSWTGWKEYNQLQMEEAQPGVNYAQYLSTGHFIQATFENWESEFLQMAMFILLAIRLRQKGSSESKPVDKEDEVDREPSARRKKAPWPVKKGGIWLKLYSNSLTLAFIFLFLLSFYLHLAGSLKDYNQQQEQEGQPAETMPGYLGNNRFWFESFQNWQSEFLSVAAIVVFSIFLRQKGSPQSKPVDAPDDENE